MGDVGRLAQLAQRDLTEQGLMLVFGQAGGFAFLLDANLLVVFENNGVTFCDLSETVARKENLPFTTIAEDSLGEGWLSENSRYLIFNRVSRTTAAAKRSGDVTHEVWDLVERKCIGKASSLLSIIRDMIKDRSGI